VAHRRTWSGRTVREAVGVLKGLGNLGAAILSEGFSSAFLLPLREKVGRVSGSDEGGGWGPKLLGSAPDQTSPSSVRLRLTPSPSRGEGEQKAVHHSGHNEGTANTTGPVRVVEAPTDNVSLLPMEEGGA